MNKYLITPGAQSLSITIEGTFTPGDVNNFVQDFNSAVAKINPSLSTLTFDCANISVVASDMQGLLKDCLSIYKKLGFKKVIIKTGSNVIFKMQAQRLSKDVGLNAIFE